MDSSISGASRGHPVFAAYYGWAARAMEAGDVGRARASLLTDATGVVLDLGAGIGLNLPHLGPAVTAVHLVEPDPHMIRRLDRTIADRVAHDPGMAGKAVVHRGVAERVPLPDASTDTVLATLTLCTVGDVPAALREIRRVLRPGGQVLVLEHVRSSRDRVARWQDRLHRPLRWFGAGCNPNRDTAGAMAAAGFDIDGLQRFWVRGMPLTPEWITGRVTVR